VLVAELARDALQSVYGKLHDGGASSIFSGKGVDGRPLEGHGHAHYLPSDDDGDGRIDALTVYAPDGFGERERRALSRLSELKRHDSPYPLRAVLLGMGDATIAERIGKPSRFWISITPFLLERHPKPNGKAGPEEQVRLALRRRGFPEPIGIESVPWIEWRGHRTRWLEFRRWRSRGNGPAVALGFGFRLEFEGPVAGPIALGYGSHYGLGLFAAV